MSKLVDSQRCKRKTWGLVLVSLLTLLSAWRSATNAITTTTTTTTTATTKPGVSLGTTRTTISKQEHQPWRYPPGDDETMLHLVKTRFMQHQGHLEHLARARLQLFAAVCLPAMVHQTTRHFTWIISVDPALDASPILDELLQLLRPYPHFYVTLTNDSVKPGGGLHGIGDDIRTGAVDVLRQKLQHWKQHALVLETQLDADDALHVDYIATIQQRAKQAFFLDDDSRDGNKSTQDWMYWCIHRDVEWYWDPNKRSSASSYSSGVLKASRSFVDKQKCYTPGMTLGVKRQSKTEVVDVPHSMLYSTLATEQPFCGHEKQHHKGLNCIQFVDTLDFPALRARTPTSASMVGVHVDAKTKTDNHNVQNELWQTIWDSFFVTRESMRLVHEYLSDHMALIVQDALEGQCSHGHSCRDEAQEALQAFLKVYNNNQSTTVHVNHSGT